MITLERVSKSYGDGTVAVADLSSGDRRRGAHRPGRPVGMRQDHDLADDQPAHRADVGPDPHRGRERPHQGPGADAPGHRLRDPARRALPPPPRLRQRGRRPPPARAGTGPGSSAASTSCSSWSASTRKATPADFPTSCRAVSASESAWRGLSGADPPVLLMDEPFAAVDPVTRQRLQNQFLELQQGTQEVDRLRHPRHRGGGQAR